MSNLFKKLLMNTVIKPMRPIAKWYFRLSPTMITCQEFNDFIFNYTEGLLSESQTARFERHMKYCPSCRNFLKTYIATYKAGKVILPYNDLTVPNTIPKELLDAISDLGETHTKLHSRDI